MKKKPKYVSFDNNLHLTALFGEHDCNLLKIEEKLEVSITSRGNMIFISGDNEKVSQAEHVLESLYHKLEQGMEVGMSEVEAALRMVSSNTGKKSKENKPKKTLFEQEIVVKTAKKQVRVVQ